MRVLTKPRLSWQRFDDWEHAFFGFAEQVLGREGIVVPSELQPGEMWQDSWQRLAEMIPRACLGLLLDAGGWSKQPCILSNERIGAGRIWDTAQFKALSFGVNENHLRVVWETFDVSSRNRLEPGYRQSRSQLHRLIKNLDASNTTADRTTTELLLFVLARPFVTLNESPKLGEMLRKGSRLCALAMGLDTTDANPPNRDHLHEALAMWGWTFPWMSRELAWWWLRTDARKFGGDLTRFDKSLLDLCRLFEMLVSLADTSEQSDWLIPLLDFFVSAYGDPLGNTSVEEFAEPLEWMTSTASLSERQLYRDAWGQLLRVAGALAQRRKTILSEHPADREPQDSLFLAHWEQREFEQTLDRVEQLRVHLERIMA